MVIRSIVHFHMLNPHHFFINYNLPIYPFIILYQENIESLISSSKSKNRLRGIPGHPTPRSPNLSRNTTLATTLLHYYIFIQSNPSTVFISLRYTSYFTVLSHLSG